MRRIDLALHERASDAAGQRLGRDEGSRLPAAIVLGEVAVDDAGPEDEAVVGARAVAPNRAPGRPDAHDVPLDVGERHRGALGVGADQALEQPFGVVASHSHRVGNDVHRAAAKERDLRQRALRLGVLRDVRRVHVEEAGDGHMIGAVAAADAKHVDVEALEVLRRAAKLVDRPHRTDDAVISKLPRDAERGPGVAQVPAALGVQDDADPWHEWHE